MIFGVFMEGLNSYIIYLINLNLQRTQLDFSYKNVGAYNKFQYGLTLSAGYDEFNINIFYGLTPIFENATIMEKILILVFLNLAYFLYSIEGNALNV